MINKSSVIKIDLNKEKNISKIFILDIDVNFYKNQLLNKEKIICNKIEYHNNQINILKREIDNLIKEIQNDNLKIDEMKLKLESL
jgi:hypothetical protein